MIENPMNSDLDCGSSSGGMAEALTQLGNTRLKQSEKQIVFNAGKKVELKVHTVGQGLYVRKSPEEGISLQFLRIVLFELSYVPYNID
jgi:hypothetical protein